MTSSTRHISFNVFLMRNSLENSLVQESYLSISAHCHQFHAEQAVVGAAAPRICKAVPKDGAQTPSRIKPTSLRSPRQQHEQLLDTRPVPGLRRCLRESLIGQPRLRILCSGGQTFFGQAN